MPYTECQCKSPIQLDCIAANVGFNRVVGHLQRTDTVHPVQKIIFITATKCLTKFTITVKNQKWLCHTRFLWCPSVLLPCQLNLHCHAARFPEQCSGRFERHFHSFSLIPLVLSIKAGCDWQLCWPYWARAKHICHLTLISKGESEARETLSNILGWLMSRWAPLLKQMSFISSEKRKQERKDQQVFCSFITFLFLRSLSTC